MAPQFTTTTQPSVKTNLESELKPEITPVTKTELGIDYTPNYDFISTPTSTSTPRTDTTTRQDITPRLTPSPTPRLTPKFDFSPKSLIFRIPRGTTGRSGLRRGVRTFNVENKILDISKRFRTRPITGKESTFNGRIKEINFGNKLKRFL